MHLKCSQITTKDYNNSWYCTLHSTFNRRTQTNTTSPKNFLKVVQLNANGIRNKTDEIQLLIKNTQADVIKIQEIKLNQSHKTPNIPQFTQQLNIANMYISPKHFTQLPQTEEDSIISSMLTTITNIRNTIITADVNIHSPLWYLPTQDYRGELIEEILLNSNHIILNTNTLTRLPPNQTKQPTLTDITAASADLHNCTSWQTIYSLT